MREAMKAHPNFELLKLNDITNFNFLQLPRWFIDDSRYSSLSLEAKFTYTLLFDRFQLSRRNGWINDSEEVFIIYTRKELSEKLNIGEKRVTAAMNELKEYMLIWERRCGRGFANQIYLADVRNSEKVVQETSNQNLKTCQNRSFETVEAAVQETPNHPSSNTDFRYKDISYTDKSQSESSPYSTREQKNGLSDAEIIKLLIEQAELDSFHDDDTVVMRDAIERLYFMQSINIGGAVYPNERIRIHLWRLNSFVIQDAILKITKNTTVKIRNSSAYVVNVLFNTIMEFGSDLIVDPYLNLLRSSQ